MNPLLENRAQAGRALPIHIFHHTFGHGGGMESYAGALVSSFRKLDIPVIVHAANVIETSATADPGLNINRLALPRFPRKLRDFRFFQAIERIRPGLAGVQVSLSRVRARDLVICGGTHRGYLKKARKWIGPFDLLQIRMETRAYAFARRVISHSKLLTDELVRIYALAPEKIVTLFPPVDFRFTPEGGETNRTEARQSLGLPPDKVVFLFPSMGHRRKGFSPISKAFSAFAGQAILAVAGKPAGTSGSKFIRHLGYLKEMAAAYRAADYTILGSYYEPFGLVGPESILCGTPLVFEKEIGCLAAVDPRFVLTFSVRDPTSIKIALGKAIELARAGRAPAPRAGQGLMYDPSAVEHARALLGVADH
jgi:glycosyltransferase involved in cell wall biosynthesis